MELTVVLTNYKRPYNLSRILSSLKKQSVKHKLFIWDNSWDKMTFKADWIIKSSVNAMCGARWWMAARAETPWVIIMDDDLMPQDDNVFLDTLEKLKEYNPQAVGLAGVQLDSTKKYVDCTHLESVSTDTRVDVVKSRYFAIATERLRNHLHIPLDGEDDIIMSSFVGGGIVLSCLKHRFLELPTGQESWCRRKGHNESRDATVKKYFY